MGGESRKEKVSQGFTQEKDEEKKEKKRKVERERTDRQKGKEYFSILSSSLFLYYIYTVLHVQLFKRETRRLYNLRLTAERERRERKGRRKKSQKFSSRRHTHTGTHRQGKRRGFGPCNISQCPYA